MNDRYPGGKAEGAAPSAPGNGGKGLPPSRRRPAHQPLVEPFNRSVIVFLTVCSKNRNPIFARLDVQERLLSAWAQARLWAVGRYVIMPDHLHLFCAPAIYPYEPIRKWIQYWKTLASRKWPRPSEQPVWQQDGWDTQLRRQESYAAKWEYVRNNPVRAGLVMHADDWPYQGELNRLPWHE